MNAYDKEALYRPFDGWDPEYLWHSFETEFPELTKDIVGYKVFDADQLVVEREDGFRYMYHGRLKTVRAFTWSENRIPEMDPEDFARELGERIAEKMHRRGYSPEHLAELIGVDPVMVYRYISGAETPSIFSGLRIADALEFEFYELFKLPCWFRAVEEAAKSEDSDTQSQGSSEELGEETCDKADADETE